MAFSRSARQQIDGANSEDGERSRARCCCRLVAEEFGWSLEPVEDSKVPVVAALDVDTRLFWEHVRWYVEGRDLESVCCPEQERQR